ncbi:NAD(P)/FAD-dependent oxidoreductase [Shigella flexneri]
MACRCRGLGASPFGYKIAEQFGLKALPTRAGLVPFTLHKPLLEQLQMLSARLCHQSLRPKTARYSAKTCSSPIADSRASGIGHSRLLAAGGKSPSPEPGAGLRIWTPSQTNTRCAPESKPEKYPGDAAAEASRGVLAGVRAIRMSRLAVNSREQETLERRDERRQQRHATEGYRTAEVTLGGVDTNELSSRTTEARNVPGLSFIGEVMDVTGWLGGSNFQWAWASAWHARRIWRQL